MSASRHPARRRPAIIRRPNLEWLEDRWVPANVGTPNQNFIDQVYRDVLHRAPDPGAAGWVQGLDSGQLDREDAVAGILGSEEGLRNQVNDLYNRFLGRQADPTGLSGWVAFLRDDHSNLELSAQLIASQEYYLTQGGGTDPGFLDAVFQDVLCRPISPGELNDRLDDLNDADSFDERVDLIEDILESDEARAAQVNNTFLSFLRRSPSGNDIDQWSDNIDGGGLDGEFDNLSDDIEDNDDLLFVGVLLSSNEYFALSQRLQTTDFATIPSCDNLPATPALPP
jgi:hypothetical protein